MKQLDTVSLNGTGGIFNIVKRSQENMPHILRTFPGTLKIKPLHKKKLPGKRQILDARGRVHGRK